MAWRLFAAFLCLGSLDACHPRAMAPPTPSLLVEVGEGMQNGTPAVSPTVHFMGRFDRSDPAGPRFAWSASGIATRFAGTGIDVRLHDTGGNEFQVVLDGEPTAVVKCSPSRDLYTLATGLPDTTHDIAIYKRTEARVGPVQFLGFVPQGGRPLLPPSRPPARRIEFIGDSITAGYGDEGPNAACHFTASTENEFLTYAAITSRNLGAEHVNLAWSGRTTGGMAELYDRTLPAASESRWDFSSWVPDVVVVNLGTNNFAMGDPGQATIVGPYVRLLERVREHYPAALIVSALGPMLSDTYPAGAHILTHARKYLTIAVETVRAKGDARVLLLEFPAQDFANGLGCDYHPSLKTHRLMAEQLTSALRAQLKW